MTSISRCVTKWVSFFAFILLLPILTTSCAGAPQYDATTDSDISNLQNETDTQMVKMISLYQQGDAASLESASYPNNVAFYNKFNVDITSLELRMEAVPDASNANLPQIFANTRTQMQSISTADKKGDFNSDIAWTASRNHLNVDFAILLTYELSLKGVSSPSSSSTHSVATKTAEAKASAPP